MKRKGLCILMLILVLFSMGCNAEKQQAKEKIRPESSSIFKKGNVDKVIIVSDTTDVYAGNSDNHEVMQTYNKNDIVDVYGFSKDWYIVVLDDGKIGAISPSDVKPYIEKVTPSEADASIKSLTPNEEVIVRYVNSERVKRGLNPLKVDLKLTSLARHKSLDILEKDYFSHYSPTYGSPFDMLNSYGVKYIYAGENLAGNDDIDKAHKQLMDSDGHRKNILSKNFTHIGVGVKEGSKYGKIITEIFVGR